jgi:hypothetical protein
MSQGGVGRGISVALRKAICAYCLPKPCPASLVGHFFYLTLRAADYEIRIPGAAFRAAHAPDPG